MNEHDAARRTLSHDLVDVAARIAAGDML